ncbi:hypothetical protein BDV18DRAFT_2811 [Aspergillus unguis]
MGDSGSGIHLPSAPLPRDVAPSPADPEEISVLVTGFGPFKSNVVNASFLIASSLPSSLSVPIDRPAVPIDGHTDNNGKPARKISIHVHPAPVEVTYSAVRTIIPMMMHDYVQTHGRQPDIVIHMGIAATRGYYSIESKAHRDSYIMPDNLGRAGYEDGEKGWREKKLPHVLYPGRSEPGALDLVAAPASKTTRLSAHPPDALFLKTWQGHAPSGADVRISEDAGRYLCEFIFYTSLALALREGRDRNVAFFHVPSSCKDEDVKTGREVAVALIKTLVERWVDSQVDV